MYVDISISTYSGHDTKAFTYIDAEKVLKVGDIVSVNFGKKNTIGIVKKVDVKKPKASIKVQAINEKLDLQPIPKSLMELADWIIDYYAASAASVWQLFLPKNPTTKPRKNFQKRNDRSQKLLELSPAQSRAINEIRKSKKPVLLDGVMGSGKTEIYFHLIADEIKKNQSCILLMPEIFLTKQMIERAYKHFGSKIVVAHSGLTLAQRRAMWDECNFRSESEGLVIIGPRSALFAPLNNTSLIIIDEFHEQSYKQDSAPRYQTEIVAAKLAKICGAKLVMGSATPNVTSRYLSEVGKISRVHLPERAMESAHPNIEVVKLESQEIISKKLQTALQANLNNNHISLLYINRRGTAPIYKCSDCGFSFECPHCGIKLHFHSDSMRLSCHVCGYRIPPPAECPSCKGSRIRGFGIGTKAVTQEISLMFPEAKIARIDTDSAKTKDFQATINKINKSEVDIIIGTQMIGRGIDIANLNLVGIINADYDFSNIDFNSTERAFQLLTQTAGRAGRRKTQGKVIIQTSEPNNSTLELITKNDFEGFYANELKLRKKYSYPPFVYLLKLECSFVNPNLGKQKSLDLIKTLAKTNHIAIIGPVPAYPAMKGNKHIWKLIIKSRSRANLLAIAKNLDSYWKINLDPIGVS